MEKNRFIPLVRELYAGKTFAIKTYGCQMNVNDSMKIESVLKACGMEMVDDIHDADLSLMNTCCVRENAENKVLGLIGSMKTDKAHNSDKIVIVLGCMTQQNGYGQELMDKYRQVDIVLGTSDADQLPEKLYDCILNHNRIYGVTESTKPIDESLESARKGRVSEFVTIMTGCNNFCSYCIVPYVRGRERSRQPQDIVDEIQQLLACGTKEIVLLGQNVNSYGVGLDVACDFADLLNIISEQTEVERIRFMTSHPKDLSKKLIHTMASNDKVCAHIHLPMQAGSTEILSKMNRKYTQDDYRHLVQSLRQHIPHIEITTDIIVGFPGETEQDFQQTLQMVEECQFASAFMFNYSKRSGTPASSMDDQVDPQVRSERLQRLIQKQEANSKKIYSKYVDQELSVLIESSSTKNSAHYTGKSSQNITVNVEGESIQIGDMIHVQITRAKKHTLFGIKVQ